MLSHAALKSRQNFLNHHDKSSIHAEYFWKELNLSGLGHGGQVYVTFGGLFLTQLLIGHSTQKNHVIGWC